MSVLKVYTKIMCSRYYGFKCTSGIRVSKDSKPGSELKKHEKVSMYDKQMADH
jgi:hypothetical protein